MTRAGERGDARHRLRPIWRAMMLAALVSACAGGPPPRSGSATSAAVIPIPDRYSEAAPPAPAGGGLAAAGGPEWWRTLGSSELDGLIDRGLANSPDMRIAVQHIVQSKARFDQARASRLPTLSAPLLIGDQSAGAGTVGAAPPGGSGGGSASSQKTWQAGVRADWQIDLWGEQSALARSAEFQLQRAIHERDNVARNLAAAIASSYVEYLSLNDRQRIARSTEELQSATLTVVEGRVKAGDATVADLEQQRAAIFSIRATMPVLEQQRVDSLANLAQLVGTVPGRLSLSDHGLDTLSVPTVITGLPSQLLLRRPDVRLAESQLRAAHADVDVARARLLPPMDLAAQIGRSAMSPAQLLLPQTLFWSVVDSLTVTLFDGGRKHNDEVFSRSVEEEMVESYVRAIHQAVREVEGALSTLRLSNERLAAEQQTLDAAHRAMDISTRIYKVGGVDYLTLLDTQRTYHRYLDDFQQVRFSQYRAWITLLQALGGDTRLPAATAQPGTAPRPGPGDSDRSKAAAISSECLAGLPGDDGQPAPAGDWQVELVGTYHCATVAPAWRDLRARYPESMRGRVLRPTLGGRVDIATDSEQSWFHLAVSRFASREQAQTFCAALQSDQLRCAVAATPLAHPFGGSAAPAAQAAAAAASPADERPALEISALGSAAEEHAGAAAPPASGGRAEAGDGGHPHPAGGRYLQLGAFRDGNRAEALRARASELLREQGVAASVHREGELTLVWAGPFGEAQDEHSAAARLRELIGAMPRSVRAPITAGAP